MEFEQKWVESARQVDQCLGANLELLKKKANHFKSLDSTPGLKRLLDAMAYSTLSGGKRFRPALCLWSLEALGSNPDIGMPFATAVEMIHAYSLIHDDLPCMDNDDFRRGQPSNHKAFDEATALLAGSTLLTEAFGLVASHYDAKFAKNLIEILSRAAGLVGMCGGQAIDIYKSENLTVSDLDALHKLKTGAMIRVAVEGATCLAQPTGKVNQALLNYAEYLGLAFQVADDVLDYDPLKVEPASYPAVVGIEETKKYLELLTKKALQQIEVLGERASSLKALAMYNQNRKN